jgi:type II secretory pathway component PulJ
MLKNKWVVVIAVAVTLIAGIWIYRFIFPPEPPQVETTNQALEAAKQENADMRRRIDELGKRVKQGAKQIKVQEREKVDALPPDAVAGAIANELRLFLGTD